MANQTDQERLGVWRERLEELSHLVTDLVQRRAVWWTLQAVFHNNPTLPPSGLFDFIAINYMESESIGVRRLLDNDGRTSSLMVLLLDLQRSVELLTRDRFVVASGWRDQVFASSRFDRFVGEPGHVHVPASRVQSDIDMLRNASAVVKKYSDKRIAHWDKTPPNTLPTFSDLHNAVAAIATVFHGWYGFITGSDLSLLPTPVYDWFAPLRVPWIRGDGDVPKYGEMPLVGVVNDASHPSAE